LESVENTTITSNSGFIVFDGMFYTLSNSTSKISSARYVFDHWEITGLISIGNANSASTTITVSGDGTLKAVYKVAQYLDNNIHLFQLCHIQKTTAMIDVNLSYMFLKT